MLIDWRNSIASLEAVKSFGAWQKDRALLSHMKICDNFFLIILTMTGSCPVLLRFFGSHGDCPAMDTKDYK
jgi:hypothetical protein